jgi:hypothetical protein
VTRVTRIAGYRGEDAGRVVGAGTAPGDVLVGADQKQRRAVEAGGVVMTDADDAEWYAGRRCLAAQRLDVGVDAARLVRPQERESVPEPVEDR